MLDMKVLIGKVNDGNSIKLCIAYLTNTGTSQFPLTIYALLYYAVILTG
jgi:hypothetical protein